MDVVIYTSDPQNVHPHEIRQAIEAAGYFVLDVHVEGREEGL